MADDPRELQDEHQPETARTGTAADLPACGPLGANGSDGSEPRSAEEDRIDWDVKIGLPPLRPSQTIMVRFSEAGRRPIRLRDEVED
jgi:hypothetical protein